MALDKLEKKSNTQVFFLREEGENQRVEKCSFSLKMSASEYSLDWSFP